MKKETMLQIIIIIGYFANFIAINTTIFDWRFWLGIISISSIHFIGYLEGLLEGEK